MHFQKAFDSIGRYGIKYKLELFGIKGKFLNVITPIYSSSKFSLFYNSHALAKFNTYVGLKQGDILGLLFFNSFINNLFVLPEKIHDLKKCNTELANARITS